MLMSFLCVQDGQATISIGKRRRKRQSSDVCNNMPDRCSRCRGNTGGTAEAQSTEFDQSCAILRWNIIIFQIMWDITPERWILSAKFHFILLGSGNGGSGNRKTGFNSGSGNKSGGSGGGRRRIGINNGGNYKLNVDS